MGVGTVNTIYANLGGGGMCLIRCLMRWTSIMVRVSSPRFFFLRNFRRFPEVKINNENKLAAKVINMLPNKFDYWNCTYVNCLSDKGAGPAHLLWPERFVWCKMKADVPQRSFSRTQARRGPKTLRISLAQRCPPPAAVHLQVFKVSGRRLAHNKGIWLSAPEHTHVPMQPKISSTNTYAGW